VPEIARIGNLIVRIFADDTRKHRAPHFHVVGPDEQMVVGLPDLNIIAGHVHRAATVLQWASEPANLARLVSAWNIYNPTAKIVART
jgi:hypothetical protein